MDPKTKTYAGVSLYLFAILLVVLMAMFEIGASGFTAGIMVTIVAFVSALVISLFIALVTKQKESYLVYAPAAFIVIMFSHILTALIQNFMPSVPLP